jgi:hypothetical protein
MVGRPEDVTLANALERVQGLLERYETSDPDAAEAIAAFNLTIGELILYLRGETPTFE